MKPYGSAPDLFTRRWQDELAPVAEAAMDATVHIYDPQRTTAVWDFVAGEWTTAPVTVFTGPARVQPLRSATERAQPGDAALVQAVLVSVPLRSVEGIVFQTFHLAAVTDAPLNPDLLRFVYAVSEVVDSSNPFERTLMCTVNQEAVNG